MTVAPRFGIHAGVWGFDWSADAAERTIGAAAAAGYDLIEIPAIDRARSDAGDTARALDRHGIAPAVSLALGTDDDITSADSARRDRGERRLTDAVAFASEIGATFVGGVVFSAMGRYLELPTPAARDRSLAVLRRIAALAEARGITLGVEYVNRYESNLLNTAAQTVAFLDDLGAPNVLLHLDTFHAAIEETSLAAAIDAAGDRLGYIHASESHRGRLGTGTIDWDRFAADLHTAGYTGPITVETFSSTVIGDAAAIDIGLWRPMWADPDELATTTLHFLRTRFAAAAIPTL
ncbi:sugar phosphate isomerase/epimerase family protein [Microbacterium sp. NPDC089695]|uniref:sugar phosphate isomerase/epimerase family protein n=1 Tax=Microbacterium sp. NPDC089695 TaxID=3364198 RepID=UPI003829C3A5